MSCEKSDTISIESIHGNFCSKTTTRGPEGFCLEKKSGGPKGPQRVSLAIMVSNYTSRVQRDAIVRIAAMWTLWLAYSQRRSRIVAVCHCYENIQSSSFAPSVLVHVCPFFTAISAST